MKITSLVHKKVFFSWLISSFVLLLVPIIISTIVYVKAEEIIKTEVNHGNSAMLVQYQQEIDNAMRDVNNFANQISTNLQLQRLMRIKGELSTYDYEVIYQLNTTLRSYKVVTGFVDDFFIYLKNTDKILMSGSFLENELFYEQKWKNMQYYDGMSFDMWNKVINGQYSGECIPLNPTIKSKSQNTGLIYTIKLPVNDQNNADATLVIILNKNRFINALKNIQTAYNGWGMIIDKENRILCATDQNNAQQSFKYEDFISDKDMLTKTLNGKKVVVSHISSNVLEWKYVFAVPEEIFSKKVVYIRNIVILSLILCVILGGGTAYYFTRRNYNPIAEMVQFLEKNTKEAIYKRRNELHFIKDVMNNTFTENVEINERLKIQNAVLKSNFLMRFIQGKINDDDYINKALDSYQIHFDTENFAIMLFSINVKDIVLRIGENPEDAIKLARFAMINVVEEIISRNDQGIMIELDDMLACLVNLSSTSVFEGKKQMISVVQEVKEFFKNYFKFDFNAAISNIHTSRLAVPEAYQEALTTMEYSLITGGLPILCFDDMKISNGSYKYTLDTEYQLINCIKAGDAENAEMIINGIFENNIAKSVLSTEMIRCLIVDLTGTLLKALPEVMRISRNTSLNETDIMNRLQGNEKILDIKQNVLDIVKELCSGVISNKKGKKDQLISEVIEFIDKNYSDINLSVSSIAENYDITPNYLTTIFKEKTGDGLFEYISLVRLEKAKKLLKEQELNIKEISATVGYYNSNVFIRAFKKYTGVTPGAYKDID